MTIGSKLDLFPSIIVLSFNTRDLLIACLRSIEDASCSWDRGIETIVVDNGSTDGSPEAVREKFPDVILLELGENLGFARGNNRGIEISRGDPVIILNSDTILPLDFFSLIEKEYSREDDVGIIAPRLLNPDGTLQVSAYHNYPDPFVEIFGYTCIGRIARKILPWLDYPFRYEMSAEEHSRRIPVAHVKGACLITRRTLLEDIGGFDERYFLYREETDFCKRATDKGWKIIYSPDISIYHHHKSSSKNLTDKGLSHRLTSHYLYLKNCHGRFSMYLGCVFFLSYSIIMTIVLLIQRIFKRPGVSSQLSYHFEIVKWHFKHLQV